MAIKSKPCKYCGSTLHFSFQCYQNPKRKPLQSSKIMSKKTSIKKVAKPLRRTAIKAKPDYKWLATRREWFRLHPPDHAGYYYCKIVPCLLPGVPMLKNEVELDHEKPKGRAEFRHLKYELSNLRESHGLCNREKGSLTVEQYQEKMERRGLWINPNKTEQKSLD
jgi:5-methylcytosine-specific restriction endonuclease McrA